MFLKTGAGFALEPGNAAARGAAPLPMTPNGMRAPFRGQAIICSGGL